MNFTPIDAVADEYGPLIYVWRVRDDIYVGKAREGAAQLLSAKGKGIAAQGFESTQGFVIKSGSEAVAETVLSMEQQVWV